MDKKRVLLVDDEPDFRDLMKIRIEDWGYSVLEASNAKEAIAAVEGKNADIVVLDYQLPDMDGIKVLKKIRSFNKKIPVIMFTVHPDLKVQEQAAKLGVNVFVPKLSVYQDAQVGLKSALNIIQKRLHT